MIADINPGAGSSDPTEMTTLGNGKFVFAANDGVYGNELWVTDGTTAGTVVLANIKPENPTFGPQASFPTGFTALGNGKVLFSADDGTTGPDGLWVTDGTPWGPHW